MPAQATAHQTAGQAADEGDPRDAHAVAADAIDPADYRRVLGHFPTGVTLITAQDADGPVGFACQAFSALSLDPPLVLFSVAHTSTTWPRIKRAGRFCVNFLTAAQGDTCRAFAVSGADKFRGVKWHESALGSPILDDVHGWVDCTIEAEHPGGDHTIVIGRIHSLDAHSESEPLVFHRGSFGIDA
jgi:3-hydroxy-9,10-secoandrosta-1,3,5(10)-triene-9,17-dione monooxygenase reductase component